MHGSIYEFDGLPPLAMPLAQAQPRGFSRVRAERAVPLVGIIRNPRSHHNKGQVPELADCSNILTETPATREALRNCLLQFARRDIDYLVVDGGDGTVRDVLTCGADIFGDEWPSFIILPKGKTNALTVDLGVPKTWSLTEALTAARAGNTVSRRPLRITATEGTAGPIQGFVLGAGVFTHATEAGQEAHRRGAFNSMAVAVSVLWVLLQTLFGGIGNVCRAPSRMLLRDARTGTELPHSGKGNTDERYVMVATTFERFPFGARPFGANARAGLKLALVDWPVRWLIGILPAVIYGFYPRFVQRAGAHRLHVDDVDMDIGESFIIDGEAFPPGRYMLQQGPQITFVVP